MKVPCIRWSSWRFALSSTGGDRLRYGVVGWAACVAMTLSAARTDAAAIFFSTVGPPSTNPGTPDPAVVPKVILNPNDIGTLHIWIKPDGIRGVNGQPSQVFANMTYDVVTSNPSVASRLTHVFANPVDIDNDPETRWFPISHGLANATADNWVVNAFGISIITKGVGNSSVANTQFVSDPEYHAPSRSFYLATLTFQANAGTAGQNTRLYFRTGSTLNSLRNGQPVPITFGNSTTQYVDGPDSLGGQGDDINDISAADAIIQVVAVPEPSTWALASLALIAVAFRRCPGNRGLPPTVAGR